MRQRRSAAEGFAKDIDGRIGNDLSGIQTNPHELLGGRGGGLMRDTGT